MPTEDKVTRKLRAILSADAKGYSLLMANDEAYTIKKLEAYRGSMSDLIRSHSGRVVDAVGDNLLAEFSSVVDAVRCAVEIQKDLQQKNADLATDKRLEFRIGVNIGDVVQEGDRIYGNGVNVAARIEGLAESGGICISRNAYSHVRDKLELGYEYLGEHSVKNIKRPIRVYKVLMAPEDAGKLIGDVPKPVTKKWIWATAVLAIIMITAVVWQVYQKMTEPEFEPARVEEMAYPLPEKPSIAVLAFDNMTGDKEQNYFCEGLSEEIISALSSVPELFVIARNSTFSYRGKSVKVQQISQELGVQYVLEGSVRKSGEKIRITAQLIDALNGHHLWSESYDRNIEDLFVVQEDIALKVITELQVKLIGREDIRLRAPCSENLKAYLTYLKAHDHFFRFTREDNAAARRLLEKAIDLDPSYACAYSMLGGTYRLDVFLGTTESPKQSFATAKKLLEKAIDLNPSLAGPRAVLASMYIQMGQYEQAIVEAEKALTISPDSELANGEMGNVLNSLGKSKEAIAFCKKAIRLDPFSTTYFRALGMSYLLSGQNEQAIQILKKLVVSKPAYLPAHLVLAAAYSAAGLIEEANDAASVILEMAPKFTLEKYSKTWRFKNPADKELIISNLRKAGLPYTPPLPLPDKPSIAVLAFDNLSGDPDQEYFSDGLTEEIISGLSRIPDLFVIARNSSFTYKGKPVKVQQIGKELGVRYVLEGSVRKEGKHVRITAQLIDATSGHHLWSKRYDRELDNIFELQDDIMKDLLVEMRVQLTEGVQIRVWHQSQLDKNKFNMEAYWKTLEARWHFFRMDPEGFTMAAQLCEEAIEIDSNFYAPYVYLAFINMRNNFSLSSKYALKALQLNDSAPMSNITMGQIYLQKRQYEKAIEMAGKAIELDPNGAEIHNHFGYFLHEAGRFEEAIPYLERAFRLNPYPPSFYYYRLGLAYFYMGKYNETVRICKKGLERNPRDMIARLVLTAGYINVGLEELAHAEGKKVLKGWPDFSIKKFKAMSTQKDKAALNKFYDDIRKAGLPE